MAFAPPRSPFSPGHDAEGPVRGRLARAAVGSAADASADDPGGDDGDGNALRGGKPLWLVASDDAPTSPGATTVAAVTRSPGASRAPRPRSERADASKGPAFAHLLRQSEHLMKRLEAAHGALAQAFGGGKQTTYMTTQLRLKHGASALKSVSEALPIGDALLNNWDAAWGSQMHHVLRAKDQAESDLERLRRHTETVLAEAEAAHAETEAYRAEMDANVDRIERAKAFEAEKKAMERKLELAEEAAVARAAAEAAAEARGGARRVVAELELVAGVRGESPSVALLEDAERRASANEAAAAERDELRREVDVMGVEVIPLRESSRELEGRAAAEKLAADAAEAEGRGAARRTPRAEPRRGARGGARRGGSSRRSAKPRRRTPVRAARRRATSPIARRGRRLRSRSASSPPRTTQGRSEANSRTRGRRSRTRKTSNRSRRGWRRRPSGSASTWRRRSACEWSRR